MAISKARKEELVAQYTDLLDKSNAIIVTEYKGMTVKELEELRVKIREADGAFHITKNSLFKVAMDNAGVSIPDEMINGQTAIGFALGEAPTMAKTLVKFADDADAFTIRGGIMGETEMDSAYVTSLSKMPSMDELRAKIVGVINSPAGTLARLLNTPRQQLINVVSAYADSAGENAAEGAAESA